MIYINFLGYELKDMTPEILHLVLEWRNREEIRRLMYKSEIITWDEHLCWYNTIIETKKSIPKVLYCEDIPMGVVIFNNVDNREKCSWSFYIGNPIKKKGNGLILGYLALEYLFNMECFEKLTGEVIEYNIASRKFHEKLGFILDARFESGFTKGNEKFDIYKYSITKEKWVLQSDVIKKILLKKFEMSDY